MPKKLTSLNIVAVSPRPKHQGNPMIHRFLSLLYLIVSLSCCKLCSSWIEGWTISWGKISDSREMKSVLNIMLIMSASVIVSALMAIISSKDSISLFKLLSEIILGPIKVTPKYVSKAIGSLGPPAYLSPVQK